MQRVYRWSDPFHFLTSCMVNRRLILSELQHDNNGGCEGIDSARPSTYNPAVALWLLNPGEHLNNDKSAWLAQCCYRFGSTDCISGGGRILGVWSGEQRHNYRHNYGSSRVGCDGSNRRSQEHRNRSGFSCPVQQHRQLYDFTVTDWDVRRYRQGARIQSLHSHQPRSGREAGNEGRRRAGSR